MWIAALLVSLAAMIGVTVGTRRPLLAPVADLDTYLDRWSVVHDGYDPRPTTLLRGWLTLMHRLARPIAEAGVLPDVVTAWAVWVALGVVALAALGGPWAVLAAVLLVLSGLGDGLDGAVAVLSDRTTAWGYVLDSVADRVTDLAFVAAAFAVGAPAWIAALTAATAFLLEYLRARAANAGAAHVDIITVGERPSRVICCALAVALGGAVPARAAELAGGSLAVLLVLSVIGIVQLAGPVYRRLR